MSVLETAFLNPAFADVWEFPEFSYNKDYSSWGLLGKFTYFNPNVSQEQQFDLRQIMDGRDFFSLMGSDFSRQIL